jgi:hypothetical protein
MAGKLEKVNWFSGISVWGGRFLWPAIRAVLFFKTWPNGHAESLQLS